MAAPDDEVAHTAEASAVAVPQPMNITGPGTALWRRPVLRTGLYGWAVAGIALMGWILWQIASELSIVLIPLVLALFPAAVLAPLVGWLKARRIPPALATLIAMFGSFAVIGGIVTALAPSVAAQFDDIGESVSAGIESVERFLASGPFGLSPVRLDDLVDRARGLIGSMAAGGGLGSSALAAVVAVTETLAGVLFGLVALFFYLKDGPRIAAWLKGLFPRSVQDDAEAVGVRAWQTVGAYIRGQLLIALVDALLIGLALVVLRVPLALPLTVLVFFGGLFPVVGAFVAGLVAVLVALATNGLLAAVILLGVIVAVQEIEGDVLAPIVLGRATELHPLATLAALTAGAVLLGILGAFLAIPVTASVTYALKYLRQKRHAAEVPAAA
jgi:putative heme transporter